MEEFERLEHARLVWIRHYLTAPSLLKPDVAPWTYIWLFGPDKNLLNVTDLSRSLFDWLLQRFALYYNIPRFRSRGGQPRKLESHHEVLGLVMAFYVGSMQHKSLCTTFGVPTSTLSRVLSGAEGALKSALAGFHPARIVWPTLSRQKALSRPNAIDPNCLPSHGGLLTGRTTGYRSLLIAT
ncbi:hypothetical protein PC119_g22113 [Phytophthora cactorum]|nr:hypothetical protein PC119_g22113 [Phytophthora cactorum]